MTWGTPNVVLRSLASGPAPPPKGLPAKFLQPSLARGGSASRTSIVMPAPFDEPVITDNESLHARRPDNGGRPGGKRDPLIEADEKGAGAGMSRTSTPEDYGLLFLVPIESYGSSYAGDAHLVPVVQSPLQVQRFPSDSRESLL